MSKAQWIRWVGKPLVFSASLIPLLYLIWATFTYNLGADPQQEIIHFSGEWSLNFLWLTLAITPLRRRCNLASLIAYRRMLGLFVYFYVCLHFVAYAIFYLGFSLDEIVAEIIERPYITVGFIAWIGLSVLAITSPHAMKRRLKKRWQTIHNAIYVISILAIVHYIWLVKSDLNKPGIYMLLLALLLGERLLYSWERRRPRARARS